LTIWYFLKFILSLPAATNTRRFEFIFCSQTEILLLAFFLEFTQTHILEPTSTEDWEYFHNGYFLNISAHDHIRAETPTCDQIGILKGAFQCCADNNTGECTVLKSYSQLCDHFYHFWSFLTAARSVLGTSHWRRTLTLNQLCNVDSWPDIGEEDGKKYEAMCRTNQHNPQVHPEVENGEDLTLGKG